MRREIINVSEHDMEILDNIYANVIKDYIEKKPRKETAVFGAFRDIFGDKDSVEIQHELRNEWCN